MNQLLGSCRGFERRSDVRRARAGEEDREPGSRPSPLPPKRREEREQLEHVWKKTDTIY